MKRNIITKALSLAMAVVLAGSIFMGCSNGKSKENNSADPKKKGDEVVTGFPIVDKPTTIKYWLPIAASATTYLRSMDDNEVYQELEKITGIDMEFLHPAAAQEGEQFNLMIASGDIPDIITGAGRYKGGLLKGIEDKVFFNITPHLAKYSPDYLKLVNSEPEIRRDVTFENGVIPAYHQIKPVLDPAARRLVVRKDWLVELGMEVPKTIDDWEKYLKGVKDKKNIKDALVLQRTGVEENFLGAYGVRNGFYLKDGKEVAFGQIQPGFKDYLTLMNKWYSFGYISKDFPTLKDNQLTGLLTGGRSGAIAYVVGGVFVAAKQLNVDVMSTPYPRLKIGDKLHWTVGESKVQGQETVVSESSKYKFEAMRWLNYPYTKEGAMLFNFGIEGKTYKIENGKPVYTEYMTKNPKTPIDGAGWVLRVHFAPKLMAPGLECNPPLAIDVETANFRKLWSDDKDVDGLYELPAIKLTAEEADENAQIMTDINSYTAEMTLKFITGAEPLSKFDDYVKRIKDMGIDKAIANNAKAYARYMKN